MNANLWSSGSNAFGNTNSAFGNSGSSGFSKTSFGSASTTSTNTFASSFNVKGRTEITIPKAISGDSVSDISVFSKGDTMNLAISTWRNQLYIFQRTKSATSNSYEFKPKVTIDDPYPEFQGISRCALSENSLYFATVSGHIKSTDKLSETVKESDIGSHSHLITGLKLLSNSHLASCSLDGKVRVWDIRTTATPKICISHDCGANEKCVGLDVIQGSLFVATDNFKVYKYDLKNPSNPIDILKTTNQVISEKTKTQGKMISCLAVRKVQATYRLIIGTVGGCLEIYKEGNNKGETHFWPNQKQTQTGEPITAVSISDKGTILGTKERSATGLNSNTQSYRVCCFDTVNAVKPVNWKEPKIHTFQDPITALQYNPQGDGYFVATGNDLAQFPPTNEVPHLFYISSLS